MRDQSEDTMTGNGQLTVPPGFRFHPTDEELLHYYLRKKVSYEAIDLDVIREVDLNKLEPWDLKEKCRVGSGQQSEWYFFSHKDKKYPTGTRTNRATMAGFWKATGRDKPIHLPEYSKKIGMRKTLVFYTGRAPHGHKTDWIMHEYRLDDQNNDQVQEEGWVVCRVFKKKNYNRPFRPDSSSPENFNYQKASTSPGRLILETTKHNQIPAASTDYSFGASLHLPQLLIPDSVVAAPSFGSSISLNAVVGSAGYPQFCRSSQWERFGDWSLLDKLLASSSNNGVDQNKWSKGVGLSFHNVGDDVRGSTQNLLFQYVGAGTASTSTETEVFKFHRQS